MTGGRPVCFNDCDQGHVFYKIDIYKERGLAIAKIATLRKEPPVYRLTTGSPDRCGKLASIFGPERANAYGTTITQSFYYGIMGRIHRTPSVLR